MSIQIWVYVGAQHTALLILTNDKSLVGEIWVENLLMITLILIFILT